MLMKKIKKGNNGFLKKLVSYTSLSMLFLVPLVFSSDHFFKFNTPKTLIVFGLVIVSSVFYLIDKIKDQKFKIFINPIFISSFIFIIMLGVSSFCGVDPKNSFLGLSNVVPVVALFALFVYAQILTSLIRQDKSLIPKALLTMFLSGIVSIIFFYTGLPEPLGKIDGSTTGNSSYLGAFILFAFASGVALFLYYKKIFYKMGIFSGLCFMVINPLFFSKDFLNFKIPFSEIFSNPMSVAGIANGAALGIFVTLVFSVILFLVYSKNKKIKFFGFVLSAVFISMLLFAGFSLTKEGSLINKVFVENKTNNRLVAWSIAKETWMENPLLGVGPNNFVYSFEKFYTQDFYKKGYAIERLTSPHNVFWEFSANTGTFGVVAYLLLVISTFFVFIKSATKREDGFFEIKIIMSSVILGYFIHNLFVFDTIISYTCLFTLIAIGSSFSCLYCFEIDNKFVVYLKKFLIIVSLIGLGFLSKIFVLDLNRESVSMNNIMYKVVSMKDFAKEREGVLELSMFGGVMEYTFQAEKLFKLYQSSISKVDDKNKIVFLSEIKSLVSNLEKVMKQQPNYADSYLVSSELLNLYLLAEGKDGSFIKIDKNSYDKEVWQKSFDFITKAIELNPNNPQNYMVLSQLYMVGSDFDKSFFYAKKYVEMAPEYDKSYEYAKSLLKVKSNDNFKIFVENMENVWMGAKPSLQ